LCLNLAEAAVTSEFVIMGLLPNLARDLHVSIAWAGFLVSGYAIGVVLGAPLLTPFLTRAPGKQVLTGLMVLFTVGNTVCALAPGYDLLLGARILAAFAQPAFSGIGAVVASDHNLIVSQIHIDRGLRATKRSINLAMGAWETVQLTARPLRFSLQWGLISF
jgi:predicted MFS family arabinose efflux permease